MPIFQSFVNVNWLAVIVAAIGHIVLSLLWYQPFAFGKAWVKLTGKDMNPAVKWMPAGILAHFLCVWALAVIINLANAKTILEGIALSLLVSISYIGTMLAGELVWEKIPFKLFLIRLGDQILTLGLASILLILWK